MQRSPSGAIYGHLSGELLDPPRHQAAGHSASPVVGRMIDRMIV